MAHQEGSQAFNRSSTFSTAAALLLAGTAMAAVPTQWTYKLIARTGSDVQSINVPAGATFAESGVPHEIALDSDGSLSVRYVVNPGGTNRSEAFLVYNKQADTIYSIVQTVYNSPIYSTMLDMQDGKIALTLAGLINSGELRDQGGGLVLPISLGGPERVYGQFTNIKVQTDGSVLYRASAATSPTNSSSTIKYLVDRVVDGQRVQVPLADCSLASPYSFIYTPAISNNGYLAGKVSYQAGGNGIERMREGQPATQIFTPASSGGTFDSLGDFVGVSTSGKVAYFARNAVNFTWALRVGDGSTNTTLAQAAVWPATGISNSGFSGYAPRVNSAGQVAYRADLTSAPIGTGVFLTDGATTFRVAGEGTSIPKPTGGSLVMGYAPSAGSAKISIIGNITLNDRGNIAFIARFADNTTGIVLASPVILRCSPADIAYGNGDPLPPFGPSGGFNPIGPDGGDFDCFFNSYFAAAPDNAVCDIAYGNGEPLPPFGVSGGFNPGVDGGDFDCFFNYYFSGCP